MSVLQSVFSSAQIEALESWVTNQIAITAMPLVDPANTGTLSPSSTINARTGVATYASVLPAGVGTTLSIVSNAIENDSLVVLSLEYAGSTGSPEVLFYKTSRSTTVGTLLFGIKNVHASQSTNGDMNVSFQIINNI